MRALPSPAARLLRAVLCVAALSSPFALRAQQAPAQLSGAAADPRVALSDSAIRAVIKERVDTKVSTGIAVGILDPNGKTRVFSYGASGTSRPIDANSVFEIGSISKTFTTAIL